MADTRAGFAGIVGDGQSAATGKFRSRSADEQSERGAGDRDRTPVLFLSCLEEQKLRFQGADHSAALRGPFPPKTQEN